MKYNEYIKQEEACQVVLDFIKNQEFEDIIEPKDRGAFISGLGMACAIITARSPKYLAVENDK